MGGLPRGTSPYWPGGAILVEDTGAPQLLRLLAEDDLVREDAA